MRRRKDDGGKKNRILGLNNGLNQKVTGFSFLSFSFFSLLFSQKTIRVISCAQRRLLDWGINTCFCVMTVYEFLDASSLISSCSTVEEFSLFFKYLLFVGAELSWAAELSWLKMIFYIEFEKIKG